jgi:putative addiction module component (TIGR02574 family)
VSEEDPCPLEPDGDIPDESELFGLTKAQIEEAERRLAEHERNPQHCSTWEEVKKRLLEGR